MPMPDDFVSTTLTSLGIETTTEMIQTTNDFKLIEMQIDCMAIYEQWQKNWTGPFSLQACYEDIFLARLCPIEVCQAEPPRKKLGQKYLGATTVQQKQALLWVSRVASILSFFGASYIIYDSLKDRSSRSMTYNQLLIGMAVFDIVTAFAWVFATGPIDEDQASHVEGAIGNERTCMAQAFFIQLGFTSIFFNVSLALYYVLVIAYDWREFHLKQIRKYLLSLPVIVGFGLAIGVLFKSHWIEYGCHILPPPEGDMWAALVFVVLPLGFSIASITTCMLMIFFQVHERAEKSKKWSIGIGQASRVEQAVFWQCLFYVCAFYITWPVLFSVYLASIDVNGPLGLTILVAYCAPIQGFHNALVYIRPKIRSTSKREEQTEDSSSRRRRGSSIKFSPSLLGMMKGMVGAKNSQQKMSFSEPPNHVKESKDMGSTDEMVPSVSLALQEETKEELVATGLSSEDFGPFTAEGA